MMKRLLRLSTELSSRKWLSRLTGAFAKSGISKRMIPYFIRSYGINAEEAEHAIDAYESLNAFFTRKLKAGARPLPEEGDALVSPVDALITGIGPIDAGELPDIKGQRYVLDELLHHSPRAVTYKNGYFFVLYLSPSDYHRIHAPASGQIVEQEHLPGRVYPVNDFALRHMPSVLSRNERKIAYVRHESGELAVIKVGALNVSSIQYSPELSESVERGQEMAWFEFGSTVVLLMQKGTFVPRGDLMVGKRVRMGETLGVLKKDKRPGK